MRTMYGQTLNLGFRSCSTGLVFHVLALTSGQIYHCLAGSTSTGWHARATGVRWRIHLRGAHTGEAARYVPPLGGAGMGRRGRRGNVGGPCAARTPPFTTGPGSGMDGSSPTPDQLREAARAAVAEHGLNAAARDAWLSPCVLAAFMRGTVPQPANLRRLVRWWQRRRENAALG